MQNVEMKNQKWNYINSLLDFLFVFVVAPAFV